MGAFYRKKKQKKITYKDDKWDGPWVSYNEDGTVFKIFTGTYKNGVKVSD